MDPYVGVTGTNYEMSDDLKNRLSSLKNVEYPELWIIIIYIKIIYTNFIMLQIIY